MSKKYTLNKTDLIKIAQAFGFAMASAMVAFLITITEQIDFGEYVFLVPFINVLLYSAKKFLESE